MTRVIRMVRVLRLRVAFMRPSRNRRLMDMRGHIRHAMVIMVMMCMLGVFALGFVGAMIRVRVVVVFGASHFWPPESSLLEL
jgi:hypothetical protein